MLKILAILLGVAIAILADQSDVPDSEPIGDEGKRRAETPEVVLQLKYDRGELNRIYLAQFRKPAEFWHPSVATRTELCTDLCHAGLGGDACGPTCPELMPVGLQSMLTNASEVETGYGSPRVDVCPALCHNMLGYPLCSCQTDADQENVTSVDWTEVCNAFCAADNYELRGCPLCEATDPSPSLLSYRALSTAEGWSAWCSVQCRQGQGGAACNCDRAPL